MKRFLFPLQTVLNVKINQKKEIKGELAKAQAEYNKVERELEELVNIEMNNYKNYAKELSKPLNCEMLSNYSSYSNYIKKCVEEKKDFLSKIEFKIDKIKQKLLVVAKEEKSLEKLKERQYSIFLDESKKIEEKMLDEFVSYKQTKREVV